MNMVFIWTAAPVAFTTAVLWICFQTNEGHSIIWWSMFHKSNFDKVCTSWQKKTLSSWARFEHRLSGNGHVPSGKSSPEDYWRKYRLKIESGALRATGLEQTSSWQPLKTNWSQMYWTIWTRQSGGSWGHGFPGSLRDAELERSVQCCSSQLH